jgi:HPt (histidine-containing phosphotransfer) domain-containing protein
MVEDAQRCFAIGMQAHVAKPIEWGVLFGTIARLTGRAAPRVPEPDRRGEIVDDAALAHLARIMGPREFAELLDLFASDLEALVAELDEIEDAQLAKRAHKIKSSAGQMGFKELVQLCATIEQDARQGAGRARIDDFRSSLRRAIGAARSRAPERISEVS